VWWSASFSQEGNVSSLVQGRRDPQLQRQELECQRLRVAPSQSGSGSTTGLLRSGSNHRRRQQERLYLSGMVQGRDAALLSLRAASALPHLKPEGPAMGGNPGRATSDGTGGARSLLTRQVDARRIHAGKH